MKTGNLLKVFLIIFSFCLFDIQIIFAQDVPDEARKHFIRGQTAVELAKLPEDYNLAITEFNLAISLAPLWAEPYYQMGLVQEKTAQYTDAIASLKKYIELAPDASNVNEVKDLIYKIEFKAEQTLNVSDIIDVLVSLGEQNWKQTGNCTDPLGVFFGIRKAGDNSVKVLSVCLYYRKPDKFYQTIKVEGPSFKFSFIWDQCDPANPGPCPIKFENKFEIISKSRVKVKQTVYEVGKESKKYNYSGEFIKN
ncbi:MAG TPA: tetratricopeptide repeat protein [Ignavibacteria bacterium]